MAITGGTLGLGTTLSFFLPPFTFCLFLLYPAIHPTIPVNLTGPAILTVRPSALRSTTLLNVILARRIYGDCARIPGADNSIVMIPEMARHMSGPAAPDSWMCTSEQKSNCRRGMA